MLAPAFAQAQEPGRVSVRLNSAALQGQNLHLNADMHIDHLYVPSHSTLALTLALKKGNNLFYLPPVFIHGSNKFKMFERAVTLKGQEAAMDGAYEVLRGDYRQSLYVSFKIPIAYKAWMDKSQLLLVGESLDYKNNITETFTDVLQKSLTVKKPAAKKPATTRRRATTK